MKNEFWAELSGVKKRFGKTVALDGLDLQVRPGELFSVLGPNGAGKSTAISLLLGLLRPDAGAAHLFGQSPFRIEPRRQIGVMMQEVTLAPELLVRDQLLEFARGPQSDAFDRAIDVQISRLRRKLDDSASGQELIRTVRNEGYIFTPKVSRTP